MSAKASVKLIAGDGGESKLFKWVAVLTGSKKRNEAWSSNSGWPARNAAEKNKSHRECIDIWVWLKVTYVI